MKRFKYFLVVFSVLALLLSFSAVDVKAQTTIDCSSEGNTNDCEDCCEDFCHNLLVLCKQECRELFQGDERGKCIAECSIDSHCCLDECLYFDCEIGSEEPSHWCE